MINPVWFIRLARPLNLAMVAIGVVVGYFVEGGSATSSGIVLAPAVAVLATAGGNGLNDYLDRDVDRIAHPKRPIPSGHLSPESALVFSTVSFILAIIVSFLVSWICLAIAGINIGLMVGYEMRLKRGGLFGNIAISYLVGSLFLFGGAAAGGLARTLILAPLAILATLGREIAKDVEDMEGDRDSRVTIPMKIGKKKATIIASSLILSAVALSPIPYLLGLYGSFYLYILLIADALFVISALVIFFRIDLGEELAKYGMLVGVGAFLGGAFL